MDSWYCPLDFLKCYDLEILLLGVFLVHAFSHGMYLGKIVEIQISKVWIPPMPIMVELQHYSTV